MRNLTYACAAIGVMALSGCGGQGPDSGGAQSAAAACVAAPGGEVSVSGAWIRETLAPSATTAAYMTICNGGQTPVELIGVSTPIASSAELHETLTNDEGVASMRPVQSIRLAPGEAAELKPGGAHLMIFGIANPLAEGDQALLNLKFANGPDLEVSAKATSLTGAAKDSHDHH